MQITAIQSGGIWGPQSAIPADAMGVLAAPTGYTVLTPAEVGQLFPAGMPGGITNVFAGSLSVAAGFFGLTFHRYPAGTTPTPTAPFGVARSHDFAPGSARVRWNRIETSQGSFDWTALDAFVAAHAAAGRSIIHTLYGTPAWASARPSEACSYENGAAAEPANLATWDAYCAACATRYSGVVTHYEVWNEPNLAGFWTGTQTLLAQMTRRASQTIKAIDPAAQIISPAVTSLQTGNGVSYLSAMMAASDGAAGVMADWIDAVGVHLYPNDQAGILSLPTMIAAVRSAMTTLGINAKPLLNTEFGLISPNFSTLSATARAAVLARMLLLSAANNAGGAAASVWYDGDPDSTLGMTTGDQAEWARIRGDLMAGPVTVVNTLRDGRVAATIGGAARIY